MGQCGNRGIVKMVSSLQSTVPSLQSFDFRPLTLDLTVELWNRGIVESWKWSPDNSPQSPVSRPLTFDLTVELLNRENGLQSTVSRPLTFDLTVELLNR